MNEVVHIHEIIDCKDLEIFFFFVTSIYLQ